MYYTCVEAICASDHKPVCALFNTKIFQSIPEQKKLFLNKVKNTFLELVRKTVPKGKAESNKNGELFYRKNK